MSWRAYRYARGSTLLEVALATALMAICVLGLLGEHLALARHAQAARARERAAFAADAIAETAIFPTTGAAEQWKGRAAAIVPQATVALADTGGGITVATITWAAAVDGAVRKDVTPTVACNGTAVAPGRECTALAFVR